MGGNGRQRQATGGNGRQREATGGNPGATVAEVAAGTEESTGGRQREATGGNPGGPGAT